MRPFIRGTTVLAISTLCISALVAPTGSASAATDLDPGPARAAADWLSAQVPAGGLFSDGSGDDYDLSVEVALGLDAVDDNGAVVTRIRDAVAADVEAYIAPGGEESGPGTARALLLAQATGGDPTDFGGVDLVARMESLIDQDGRVISRIGGVPDPSGDSTTTQALAVRGLATAGSSVHDRALQLLLAQQCGKQGWFRDAIPVVGGDPCAEEPGPGSTSTAQALLAISDVPSAAAARQAALRALGTRFPPTAITAGLAARASLAVGDLDGSSGAATWLRAHQAVGPIGNCDFFAAPDVGAVLIDDQALRAAKHTPMDAAATVAAIRATAAALPGLLVAPAGDDDPHVSQEPGYLQAGKDRPARIGIAGTAPGEPVCVELGANAKLEWGTALNIRLPHPPGTYPIEITNAAGTFGTVNATSLPAARLDLAVRARTKPGREQRIELSGLAPGESASVEVTWPAIHRHKTSGARGSADADGVFVGTVTVPEGAIGRAEVTGRGAYGNRKARATFRVVR